mmetsp:Transcript_28410/g.62210  ORF Transcript_28410/g.62210 Transcript_28410/m.62210 type:complete len:380 (-) Transcript_28410:100-1239(-)
MSFDILRTAEVFRSGDAGYAFYRIPSLLLANRTLVAFAEGRQQRQDHGHTDLVHRRSNDGGRTWSELKLIYSESDGLGTTFRRMVTIGNPTAMYDEPYIVLFFCRNNKELLMTRSPDLGSSWEVPTLLSWTRPPDWEWVATGPPSALRLSSGRYVLPCDGYIGHPRFYKATEVFSFVLTSDDQGKSWRQSDLLAGGNECEAARLHDGRTVLNMRSRIGRRFFSTSTDDGLTWSAPRNSTPQFADGNCQGSMISLHGGRALLATSVGPGRSRLRAHVSRDGGASWRAALTIEGGAAGYSSLQQLPAGLRGTVQDVTVSVSSLGVHTVELSAGTTADTNGTQASEREELVGCLYETRTKPRDGHAATEVIRLTIMNVAEAE